MDEVRFKSKLDSTQERGVPSHFDLSQIRNSLKQGSLKP